MSVVTIYEEQNLVVPASPLDNVLGLKDDEKYLEISFYSCLDGQLITEKNKLDFYKQVCYWNLVII